MKDETSGTTTAHLADDELFALAVPPTGAPEPLPAHLSGCLRCSRALAEWKNAMREVGDQDYEVWSRRSTEEWRAREDATLEAIRRAGAPGRGAGRSLRWTLPLAASLLLFGLLIGTANHDRSLTFPSDETTGFSAQDRADDELLREVERLASGEESATGWGALAPEPAPDAVVEESS